MDGIRAFANRTSSSADQSADQRMRPQPDFVHEFVSGTSERTLLLLHGTGGNEHDLIPLGRKLDPTAALLSPRGKVLENGMPRFFRRLEEGVFDIEDLKHRTHELADFVAEALEGHGLVGEKPVAVGFSNGANIAASMLLLRPEVLGGAILFRPMVPFVPAKLPALQGTPVFIGAGRTDPIARPDQTERMAALLREAGADVTLHWEAAGHALGSPEAAEAREWLSPPGRARAAR